MPNEQQTMQIVLQSITLVSVGVTIGVSVGSLYWLRQLVNELRTDYKSMLEKIGGLATELAVLKERKK